MKIEIEVPANYQGSVAGELTSRRGMIVSTEVQGSERRDRRRSAAGRNVRLLDRPAQHDAGPGHVHHGILQVPPRAELASRKRSSPRRRSGSWSARSSQPIEPPGIGDKCRLSGRDFRLWHGGGPSILMVYSDFFGAEDRWLCRRMKLRFEKLKTEFQTTYTSLPDSLVGSGRLRLQLRRCRPIGKSDLMRSTRHRVRCKPQVPMRFTLIDRIDQLEPGAHPGGEIAIVGRRISGRSFSAVSGDAGCVDARGDDAGRRMVGAGHAKILPIAWSC